MKVTKPSDLLLFLFFTSLANCQFFYNYEDKPEPPEVEAYDSSRYQYNPPSATNQQFLAPVKSSSDSPSRNLRQAPRPVSAARRSEPEYYPEPQQRVPLMAEPVQNSPDYRQERRMNQRRRQRQRSRASYYLDEPTRPPRVYSPSVFENIGLGQAPTGVYVPHDSLLNTLRDPSSRYQGPELYVQPAAINRPMNLEASRYQGSAPFVQPAAFNSPTNLETSRYQGSVPYVQPAAFNRPTNIETARYQSSDPYVQPAAFNRPTNFGTSRIIRDSYSQPKFFVEPPMEDETPRQQEVILPVVRPPRHQAPVRSRQRSQYPPASETRRNPEPGYYRRNGDSEPVVQESRRQRRPQKTVPEENQANSNKVYESDPTYRPPAPRKQTARPANVAPQSVTPKPARLAIAPLPSDTDGDGIPGEAGMDYPTLHVIPETRFACAEQEHNGYYADLETSCQVVHLCQSGGVQNSFLCPNGTIFSQEKFSCQWWYKVNCADSPRYYSINDNLYKVEPSKRRN